MGKSNYWAPRIDIESRIYGEVDVFVVGIFSVAIPRSIGGPRMIASPIDFFVSKVPKSGL